MSPAVKLVQTFTINSAASLIYPLGNNAIPPPFIPPTDTPDTTSYSASPSSKTFANRLITPA